MRGIIVRVRLKQFMVFTDVEMRPGRNVNFVIAPNGCGKSSLISGIMLGLGAKPQDIGRSSNMRDYVKSGFTEASIEVELQNHEENYIIIRHINVDNKSVWSLNGVRVTHKQMEDLMAELHIQVSNLCQVLPQDRVYEFSRMNPQALLESTEKSVGPEILVKNHNELKEMSKKKSEYEQKQRDQSARWERETSSNRSLESTVEMMKKKAHFMERIEFYKQQRAWIVYREQYTRVQELKNSVKEAKNSLQIQKRKEQQITAGMETLKNNVAKLLTAVRSKNEEKKQVEFKLQKALEDSSNQKEEIEKIAEKFEEAKNSEELRLKELEQLLQHLSKLECDLANYSNVSEKKTQEMIKQITTNMTDINQKLTEIRHEEEILQDRMRNIKHNLIAEQEKKRRLEDKANQRLNYVRRLLPDVYEAIMWLRENSHEFTHKIYEPIMLEIEVQDDTYIKFLEEAIPKRDLQAFTCENKEDMNKFITIMREQRNLTVNILYSGPEHLPSSSYVPKVPMEQLRKYGFYMFVKDMFTAPEAIMKYLCRTAGVYRIPVGDARVDDVVDKLPQSVNFFFSGINKYYVRVSKYSREKGVNITSIQTPRYLSSCVDSSELIRIDESIKQLLKERISFDAQLSRHQEEKNEKEEHLSSLRDERRKLQAGIGGKELTERRIKAKHDQIATLEGERVNIDEERNKAYLEKNEIISSLCAIDQKIGNLAQNLDQAIKDFAEINWNLRASREHLQKRENDAKGTIRASAEQADTVRRLEDQYIRLRDEAKQLHSEALKYTNGKSPDESFYELITDDRDALSRKIQELQAKADFMSDGNSNIVQEYEKRKKTIEELKKEIQVWREKVQEIDKKIAVTREKWLPELNKFIEKINQNFGKYFAKLGCAGEILLTYDDPDNYEQYGINIKVKFRDGDKLQDLNSFTQSGGERSVSTALYMIAMQELTHVPFRCVDEINQGMDAVNERRVFELLANTPAGDNTPQYFLLTPKLLPHLTYSQNMSVTCIMNGTVERMSCWDVYEHAEARMRKGNRKKLKHSSSR